MKNTKLALIGGLSAAIFLIFLVAQNVSAETYVIGSSIAITGPTSDVGSPYAKGIEDYCKFTNDANVLGKDRVECIVRDDAYQTANTKRNFEDYMDQDMVIYLNYSTGSTLGLKKDFEEEKIPVLPASFHAGNLDESNYIFLPIASYSEQAIGLVEYVVANHKEGTPKFALFLHPSAFGRGPLEDVKKALAAGLKAELVEVVEHGNDLDYTATITRLLSKGVSYVISQTVQPPVATLLKDANRLGKAASSFGEKGKLTFLGCHYAGGPDLVALAGSAADGTFWTTSYTMTIEQGAEAIPIHLAKAYGRDTDLGKSQNYMNGIMAAQIAIEAMKRVKAKGGKISKASLYDELNLMNGANAYSPGTTVGPVTFSKTDRAGVDTLQLYLATDGVFRSYGKPFTSEFYGKIK
ncbi:ABC transporter substrate-binding protein [bacterium]|nr:ABC transporter substrate-binding protein [bacterium]